MDNNGSQIKLYQIHCCTSTSAPFVTKQQTAFTKK